MSLRLFTFLLGTVLTLLPVLPNGSLFAETTGPSGSSGTSPKDEFESGNKTESGGGSLLNPVINLNRTSGPASFAVIANGIERSSGFVSGDYLNSQFNWDFDSTGVDRSNPARRSGAITSHVYRQPGTYTVTLSVTDLSGQTVSAQAVTVSVTDPGSAYETYCFTTTVSPDFTGCPTSVQNRRIVTDSVATIFRYVAPDRRLLLKRGAEWSTTTSMTVNSTAPVFIGAFPNPNFASSSRPTVRANLSGYASVINASNSANLTVAGIQIIGNWDGISTAPNMSGIGLEGALNSTVIDSFFTRLNGSAVFGSRSTGTVISHNRIEDNRDYGIYAAAVRDIAISSNIIHRLFGPNHGIRLQGVQNTSVQGNEISDIHQGNSLTIRGNSTNFFVSGNTFKTILALGPENLTSDQRLVGGVVENNTFIPPTGVESMRHAISWVGSFVTFRNNIFTRFNTGIIMPVHPLVPDANNTYVYNNTYHNPGASAEHSLLFVQSLESSAIHCYNNFFYSASSRNAAFITYLPSLNTLSSRNNAIFAPNAPPSGQIVLRDQTNRRSYLLSQAQALGLEVDSVIMNSSVQPVESTDPGSADYMIPTRSSVLVDSGMQLPLYQDITGYARPVDGDGDNRMWIDRGARERR